MGRSIAAFYSPDDGLEHALQVLEPYFGLNSGYVIQDFTFSPSTQAHVGEFFPYTSLDSLRSVAGLYCPVDGNRYGFYATQTNEFYWVGGPFDYLHIRQPPKPGATGGPVGNLIGYPLGSVTDIAAFFSSVDGRIILLILMRDGTIWRASARPWANEAWNLVPFLTRIAGARRISGFDGAAWEHTIVATDHEITELWYRPTELLGQAQIWASNRFVLDIGCFYTAEDGVAHIVAATSSDMIWMSDVYEITYTPSQVPPSTRKLGTTDFRIDSIGAYTKPDGGRHIIMLRQEQYGPLFQRFLSWYYPGWAGFAYSPWPTPVAHW